MRTILRICILTITVLLTGCCSTYIGYGRYTLKMDCDQVQIDGINYKITMRSGDLVVADHTFDRGIYRKTRPWLYLHHVDGDEVDITFEEGSKAVYPLYTGVSASIFDVYARSWEMTRSTNAAFTGGFWLVSHRWSNTGIFFDLQKNLGDVTAWQLVKGDIFVPGDGTEVTVSEINTSIRITSFDAVAQEAMVQFTAL